MIKLNGLHLLLTYQCTHECEHCFVWGSPFQTGVMNLDFIRTVQRQAQALGTVEWIYFEGGEPFLYYPVMLRAIQETVALGFKAGIVSNSYWAIGQEDALVALQPLASLVEDMSVSNDLFHWGEDMQRIHASTALDADGYEVILAVDGAGAVALFESTRPDCVVLDVVMPDVDGLEACRRIRGSPAGRDVPILVLTSRDAVGAVGRAYDAGATDFLAKGSGHRLLTERVRFLLREHDARRDLLVSQARLTAVQSMARIGHWELDRDGGTVDMSGTVGNILGDAAGAASGLGALLEAVADDDRTGVDSCIANWRRDGEPFRLDCQLRTGAYIHIQGASTPEEICGNP